MHQSFEKVLGGVFLNFAGGRATAFDHMGAGNPFASFCCAVRRYEDLSSNWNVETCGYVFAGDAVSLGLHLGHSMVVKNFDVFF